VKKELLKYKETFLTEGAEHISGMEKRLLELEKDPARTALVNDIFREVHTLKGMAATMQFDTMTAMCHAIENILDAVRKTNMKIDGCFDTLFESFNAMKQSLKEISKKDIELDVTEKIDRLKEHLNDKESLTRKVKTVSTPAQSRTQDIAGELAIEKIQDIGVKVEKLDKLMNLTEELLINKMRLDRMKDILADPELSVTVDTQARLLTELQYNVMLVRMVPIGFIFDRFPMMVRNIAKSQKKEVNLTMEGADIEFDRSVIDEVGESLLHLIRNAIDHGIESPDERKKAVKASVGSIHLSAVRAKDNAVIKVADDGGGLDIDVIKRSAVKKGIISDNASEEEVMDSIFLGASVTQQATEISGRGFGMNIVKEKIESINGTIRVESDRGKGTAFTIEIPLTLAIIKTLFVEAGGRTYAIPLSNIERLVTVTREDIKGMVNYEAFVLDEEDIPIVDLDVLFGGRGQPADSKPIVIIKKGNDKLGLAVDKLLTTQEIVIKPLNKLLKENRYFSGSTIIGSGEVVLVLDLTNLILTKRLL